MGIVIRGPIKMILPISVLFSFQYARAQSEPPFYEFGLNVGRMVYQGDLTPSPIGAYRASRTSFGLSFAKVLPNSFSIRGSFVHGGLAGNDALYSEPEYRKQRAFRFSSPVNEFTGQLAWSYPGV